MTIKVGITGGASAGHVVPALAVAAELKRLGVHDLVFYGRADSIEEEYARKASIEFCRVPSAGLRRYWSWRTLAMPFTVIKGIVTAILAIHRTKPDVLFSKGSYVSVPVGIGAWVNRVPLVIHESDHSLGLANRILAVFADKICTTSPDNGKISHRLAAKLVTTGLPIRDDLAKGQPERLRHKLRIPPDAPVLLIFCGSSGSVRINQAIRACLRELLSHFAIVHVCGKGNVDPSLQSVAEYWQMEYLHDDMVDALWLADLVVGRAGATTLAELSALLKPAVLVPLPESVSRGDQLMNAQEYARKATCIVVPDENLGGGQALLEACVKLMPTIQPGVRPNAATSDIHRAAHNVTQEILALTRP
ncbi:MAG: UDP-N-acetylglucosamine--N-acetylmuramyl-(pentapeptide) pyrophosphoryl-undecaprenol N-acetylglucosamine transferase [Pseudonocardiaceae bacterium]